MTQPIAGNQFFTGIFDKADQLPQLNIVDLVVNNASVISLSTSLIKGTPSLMLQADNSITLAASKNVSLEAKEAVDIKGSQTVNIKAILSTNLDGPTISVGGGIAPAASKIGFFAVPPIPQPTTAFLAVPYTSVAGTTLTETGNYNGYTVGQVVNALIKLGFLEA